QAHPAGPRAQTMRSLSMSARQDPQSSPSSQETLPGFVVSSQANRSDLADLLDALQTLRLCDASVRMREHPDPLLGKIASYFNDIASGQQELLLALQAMREGDFSVRIARDGSGLVGKMAEAFNHIASTNQTLFQQLRYVGEVVGKEGRTRQRVRI